MEQQEIDILCVNTQSKLGKQGAKLVEMISTGDISAPVFTAKHLALHSLMRSIKDYDVTSLVLTDEQQFTAQEKITDLIGVRILHLCKEDWPEINIYIQKIFKHKITEGPIAKVKEKDPPELIEMYEKNGCIKDINPSGYRSVHYNIKSHECDEEITFELQVRTLLEEAWSEIDHSFRYPHNLNNSLLSHYSNLLNKFTSPAEDTASMIMMVSQLESGRLSIKKRKVIANYLKIRNKHLKESMDVIPKSLK